MAIKVISNYAKRLGLPGYSSHQFSVSVETELSDLEQVDEEVARQYHSLQEAVDREIQTTGFVPGSDYGQNGGGYHNRSVSAPVNGGNGQRPDTWNCSDKQKELILKLVADHNLDRNSVEETSVDRFGVGVRQLNKLQASGLISELLESCSKRGTNGNRRNGGKR